jgi:hypothetical protein
MSRQRISWDEEKAAAILKQADPYTMNQKHENPPASKYETGGSYEFGEEPCEKNLWTKEKRDETGHAAPMPDTNARQAIVQAKLMEDKALKCITVASRMLPGADESAVEDQATDLMFLPERALLATLQRQSDLATKIASEMSKDKEDEKKEEVEAKKEEPKDEKKEEVEAKKEEPKDEKKEEVEAKKCDPKDEKKEEVEAKKEEPKDEKKEEVEAKKEEPKDEKKKEVEAKKEEPKDEEDKKEASKDLLDIIFSASDVVPQEPKLGAKTLQGLVKQASSDDPLSGLWDIAPDVSSMFK